ncbi:thioredoxin domain-containing protein [Streptomyces sp. NPDC048639]|uniref:thioredoxin domain-containing protein n=1 Tax=Streptomyces sp. NPDC048639 TaxID=3365581 RepID=UPI003721ED61
MSNRNSKANKAAARERLREERARQAKREKIRRQLVVGGSIVAVLGIAAGIGIAVSNMGGGSGKVSNDDWVAAAKKESFAKPANTSGDKGTVVVIGDKKAKNTVEVYEDMRCPVCASFEQASGDKVTKDVKDGKYKLQFTLGAFLDENPQIKGSGSKNALSALGAALNVGPDAFLEYKKALFAPGNHPEETEDKFADDAYLLKIAKKVDALKGNAAFEKAVKGGTYDRWALAMKDRFNDAKDVTGTPSFKVNGVKMTVEGAQEGTPIVTPEQFDAAYEKALQQKG